MNRRILLHLVAFASLISTLQSTAYSATAHPDGELTIVGVARPVHLNVTSFRCIHHPVNKREMCGADASLAIKRSEWGIKRGATGIGDDVRIQNNVSVYTGVILEDDVFCGPSMVFTNVVNPRSHVSRKDEYRTTLVKRGASIGANATVVCGHTIGRYAFIGAGAVVTRDIPDYALVVGNPGRLAGWMCQCGIKLTLSRDAQKDEQATCTACGTMYVKRGGVVREGSDSEGDGLNR